MRVLLVVLCFGVGVGGCQSVIAPLLESHRDMVADEVAEQASNLIVEEAVERFMVDMAQVLPFADAVGDRLRLLVIRYINKIIERLRR